MASEEAEKHFNKSAQQHAFLPDQLVLLDEHSFLAKNQQFAPKWSGPHKILRLKGDCNVETLLRHNNKKLITHVNRLKPYFVQSPSAVSSPDFFPAQKDANETTPKPKIFTPTMMKFWKRSFILTLPLQLKPKLRNDTVQLRLHHLSIMTKRSIVLTLPLHISSHMLMSFIALVNAYLRLHQLTPLSPRTALPRGHAHAQARLLLSVQNFTCPKSPLTRFQF